MIKVYDLCQCNLTQLLTQILTCFHTNTYQYPRINPLSYFYPFKVFLSLQKEKHQPNQIGPRECTVKILSSTRVAWTDDDIERMPQLSQHNIGIFY